MSKFYKWAIIAVALTAIAYTCFTTYSNEHAPVATEYPAATVLTQKKKKTNEERARFAEERAKFEFDMLKDPLTGKIPVRVKEQSKKQAFRAPQLSQQAKGTGFVVTPRGPDNFGGRTRAIAIDLSDATNNTIIAGGVSSGVFRTTNGGTSWTKVSSNDEIHNVTAIVQDPRAGFQNIWYYGTGEALGNSASLGVGAFNVGYGVWKSTDSGLTWTRLANSTSGSLEGFQCADLIFRMAVDPTNGNVYAAIPNAIIRSTDGGATWNTVLGSGCSSSGNGETDIIISSTGVVYVGRSGDSGSANDGVWTSTTGALSSYTRLAGNSTPAGWDPTYDRIVLALAPSDEDILYALFENNFDSECGVSVGSEADLWVYDASGPSWTDLSANMPDETGCLDGNDPFAVQGGYDLCIAVKPDDPNTVFIGGTNVYRSTDGFTTTTNTTRIGGYVSASSYGLYANHHPDIHFLTFAQGGSGSFDEEDMLFTGTDGGIHRGDITAGTVAWTSLNNDYVTYQYYHAAIDPTTASNTLIGGAQDNGTTMTTAAETHTRIRGGDGVAVGIATDGTKYFGTQNGTLRRGEGAQTFITPSGSKSIFITYFLLDPDNTEYLYYAGESSTIPGEFLLYRTTSASTVTTGTWTTMAAFAGGNIRSMATSRGSGYAASDANRKLYIGTDNGEVWRLDDPAFTASTNTPVEITPGSAGSGIVSSISVNPDNDNEVLVTYSNYNTNSVYHTTNANDPNPTWADVEGNISLSSFRSSSIVNAGGVLYYLVGTSVGLYCTQTLNGGSTTWTRVGPTSIGYALVSQLALRPVDNFLVAGTHGNGMFMVQAPSVPSIAFASTSGSTTEATAATTACRDYTDITVSMVITLAPTGAAVATLTTSGTAVEGVDYDILNASNEINFPDGATATQDVDIRIYDDTNPESSETIILDFTVSGTTDAIKASSNITHTLTINDNDLAPGSGVSLFTEDFESGFAGWNILTFAGNTGNSTWAGGSAAGLGGATSLYMSSNGGISAGYDPNFVEDNILRSPLINATGLSNMVLDFDFKCLGDVGADYGRLYYSFNGTSFAFIEGNSSAPYVGVSATTNRTINLPAALDNQSFYLGWRWTQDADGTGNNPGFAIDDISITTGFSPTVETVLNATDEQYFGPFETVHFYAGGDLVLSLQNNSSYDYGCTTVTIDREGISAQSAWSAVTGEELASKAFLVTPTNNSPPGSATYDIILYYSQAEIDGWIANSDVTHTTADFKIVKSSGSITALNIGSTNASVNAATNYAAYGSDHSFTATFDGGFSGFGGGDPSNPVLPVEFTGFTGKQIETGVQLDWSTSLELNSDRFEIERSSNGREFEEIGRIASIGGANGAEYLFIDPTPNLGRNYYRLRQVDIDGKFAYSSTVEVSFKSAISYSIYPNPFRESFQISISDEGDQAYEFELFDLTGKKVYQTNLTFSGQITKEIRLESLAPGAYLYLIRTEGSSISGKISKY